MPYPDLSRVTPFYHRYIRLVEEEDILEAFHWHSPDFIGFLLAIPADKHDFRYAEDKWSIKEVVQHLVDAERVFSYRAMCFARGDKQVLPGFDENEYAKTSRGDARNWEALLNELMALRNATEYLFQSFDASQLDAGGISEGNLSNYTLALGYVILGHCRHHKNIITERYL